MIVPDLNLLLYAYDASAAQHRAAAAWWEDCLNGSEPVGIAGVVLFGFARIATSPRIYRSPVTLAEVSESAASWLARPHVVELDGGPGFFGTVLDLLRAAGTAGKLVTDAQIAATAIAHGGTVFSNDSDFRRFPGLRVVNPLDD
ncbi:MAG: TA system VapC family ribonuclease toxin [Candidatus Binatia bacterium]